LSQDRTNDRSGPESATILLGQRYAVKKSIGVGGMGSVFTAMDAKKREQVAVKNLGKLDAEAIHSFKLEFRDFQHLHHPNLCGMDEFFEHGGNWYFSMEYVPGREFLTHVRKATMPSRAITSPATLVVKDSEPLVIAEPPVIYRAYPGRIDEDAMKDALKQLLNGLTHFHNLGKVHRDLKSPNILVQEDGRLVVIDFGIAMNMFGRPVHLAGTPLYMSPEAFRRAAAPMADWYALGVILYQAMTGRDPYEGDLGDLILQKRQKPVHPCIVAPEAPEDLADMAMTFLEPRSDLRGGRGVLINYLEGHSDRRSGVRTVLPTAEVREVVVGRKKEQDEIRALFATFKGRPGPGPTLVRVEGESGIGKTLLIDDFLHEAKEKEQALVFRAKVIEEELVPYKAVDGVIDCLADFFVKVDYDEAPLYFSDGFEIVCDTFPVLRRAARLAELPKALIPDPIERRLRMFASLKDCLRKIGSAHHLIVLVDDIQWTDADSLILWADLLAGPNAPRMFHITSIRSSVTPSIRPSRSASPLNQAMKDLPAFPRAEFEVNVQRFQQAEAEEYILGRIQLGATTRNMGRMTEIARESFGHPLFIEELLEYDGAAEDRPMTLEAAYARRIGRLSTEDLPFLEIACCSAKPIPTWIVGRAAGLQYAQYLRATKSLRQSRLIKTGRKVGQREDDWVEPFHSRVQYACIDMIPMERRAKRHRAIAETLEEFERTDYELLALEWRDAGEAEKAARYYEQAGDAAVALVSFKKAVEFFEESLATFELPKEERLRVTEKLGRAYRGAGNGKKAADTYLAVAKELESEQGFPLRTEAAELLLSCGYLEEGRREIKEVLAVVGLSLPDGRRTAFARFIAGRARISARGYKFNINPAASKTDIETLNAMWAVCVGFGSIDPIQCFDYCARYALLALDVGDAEHVTRALAGESCVMSARGGKYHESSVVLIEEAEKIVTTKGTLPVVWQARTLSYFLSGQWQQTLRCSRAAQIELLADLRGAPSELAAVRQAELWSLFFLGEIKQLHTLGDKYLRDAVAQQNRQAILSVCSGYANFGWLAYEGSAKAQEIAGAAMRDWTRTEVHLQHLFHLIAEINSHLASGRVSDAITIFRDLSRHLKKGTFTMASQMNRLLVLELEARLALATLRQDVSAESRLRRTVAQLRDESSTWGNALAMMYEVAQALTVKHPQTADMLERALFELDRADMVLHADALRTFAGASSATRRVSSQFTTYGEYQTVVNTLLPRALA
jgi:eukaryotic-like serine/threonine-protein kinase